MAHACAYRRRAARGALGFDDVATAPPRDEPSHGDRRRRTATLALSACTSTSAPSSPRARADEPVDEGLAEEIAEQQETLVERTEALEASSAAGTSYHGPGGVWFNRQT